MAQSQRYIFVLWADQFEEAPATIFVTELREAGLRVKVVGLTPPPISGSHGLILSPDLTMNQAMSLAAQVICLIIPQGAAGLQNLNYDPRLQQLFDLVGENQTKFVMGALNGVDMGKLGLFPLSVVDRIIVYPQGEEMMGFCRELARLLREV